MRIERFFLVLIFCSCALYAQIAPSVQPSSAERKDVAWQHQETLPVTLSMAKQHVISRWQKQGYTL
ncbi:MAG: hypothetical protein J6W23_09325, partial [Victivallales bacterium]|nr:hypothetical protein [Victivallales bacterium]